MTIIKIKTLHGDPYKARVWCRDNIGVYNVGWWVDWGGYNTHIIYLNFGFKDPEDALAFKLANTDLLYT